MPLGTRRGLRVGRGGGWPSGVSSPAFLSILHVYPLYEMQLPRQAARSTIMAPKAS